MISIICSNCNASYTVPPHLAGKTVSCKRCNALLDVPDDRVHRAPVAVGQSGYSRIVGKRNPLALDIIGITTRLDGDFGTREILQLLWALRHIALLIILLILWSHYASTNESALYAAPFFFFAGILILVAGWIQLMNISRHHGGGTAFLSQFVSSFVLIGNDFRAALPAIRTMFLGLVTLIVSFALASQAGGISNVLPFHFLPSKPQQRTPGEYTPLPTANPNQNPVATTAPKPPPPPPPPPPEDDKPLPPPEEVLPAPN